MKQLGVKSTLSTAYHPQTDGQSERYNQEIEAYLRMFCSQRRDDWVRWLPIAEFALNSRTHDATGYSPFYLMYGFNPDFTVPVRPTDVPAADERIEELRRAREDATAALNLSAERMKAYFDRYVRDAPQYKEGDKVWLDTRHLRVVDIPRKLVNKYTGPYRIKRKISNLAYELDLPLNLPVHPVFHVSLLLPHHESPFPGRHLAEPGPIEVEGDEEYEVEEILDSRLFGRWKKLQYLVRWKDWGPVHDSWEDAGNVTNSPQKVADYYARFPAAPRPKNPRRRKRRS